MKKILLFTVVCCTAWIVSCNKEAYNLNPVFLGLDQQKEVSEKVFNFPSNQSSTLNVYLKRRFATQHDFAVADGTKTIIPDDNGTRGYDYRFKLVSEYATLEVTNLKGNVAEM